MVLNEGGRKTQEGRPTYGKHIKERNVSKVHLHVDRNGSATVDIATKLQIGR